MYTAKVFVNGGSQAVRLPKEFRFSGDEIYVKKIGDSILLVPKDKLWETFLEGVDGFMEDYFDAVEERVEMVEEREGL